VQQVETYRQQFPAFYAKAASGNASADVTLSRSLKLSMFPSAGVLAGGTASGAVAVQTAPASDLTVQLQTANVYAQAPASVKIAAGTMSAAFTVTGVKSGVEELTATPSDGSYETAFARVQVADASFARLSVVSGGSGAPAPTVVQLSDINGLPYPGATVNASAVGGSVAPASAVTDVKGQATFQWTPASSAVSKLTLTVGALPGADLTLETGSSAPVLTAVVNAASSMSGITPGSLGTLYGANLAGGASVQSAYPWPSTLGGAQVLLGGMVLPLLYASDGQMNFYVPAEAPLGASMLTVLTPGGGAPALPVNVTAVQPGIFPGAILHAGTADSALTVPGHAGDFVEIYCTGLGVTRTVNGLQVTAVAPTVFIGGVPVAPAYSGLAPGFVGLFQVDARIPAGLAPGAQGVILSSGSSQSNEIKILVQ